MNNDYLIEMINNNVPLHPYAIILLNELHTIKVEDIKKSNVRYLSYCEECDSYHCHLLDKVDFIFKLYNDIQELTNEICDYCWAKIRVFTEKVDPYISKFLDGFGDTSKNISNCSLNDIRNFDEGIEDSIAKHIKRHLSFENYKIFLKTPYWQAIRNYKLNKVGNKCQLCNSIKGLSVHHKTYEHHGYEHKEDVIDNDLIVLCDNCHKKFHDKVV